MDVSRDPIFRDLGTDHPRADHNKSLDSLKGGSLDLEALAPQVGGGSEICWTQI